MTNKINEKMKELIGRSSFLDYRELWSKKEINTLYQIMQLAPFCFIGILIANLFVTVSPLIPLLMLICFNIIHKRIMQI